MKILVVDDDKLILKVISHFLKINGFETILAQNGFEAFSTIKKEKVDLIICDVMMPNLSGLELLNLMREFYHKKIPKIIISSLNMNEVVLCSIGLGVSDYISKPIDFNRLLSLVRKYDKKKQV